MRQPRTGFPTSVTPGPMKVSALAGVIVCVCLPAALILEVL